MANSGRYNFVPASETDKKFVARLIKEARFARGMTPREAAISVGVNVTAWYRWEAGEISSSVTRILCWLLKDKSDNFTAEYWRERALLAERRLVAINENLKEYSALRKALETGDDEFEPSSVSLPKGTRVRAA